MSADLPSAERIARRIVEDEAQRAPPSPHDADLILRVWDKMHPPFSRLAGSISYRALVSRALAQARPHATTLDALHVEPDGHLVVNSDDSVADPPDPVAVRQDTVVLVAAFLNLLIMLIGEALTVRMIHQVWPGVKTE